MKIILIYITHRNLREAKKVVEVLLKKKLIACANFFPIESMYWWKGTISGSEEIVSVVKTKKVNWAKIKKEVGKIHPYKIPCIVKIEAEANEAYAKWVGKEVRVR